MNRRELLLFLGLEIFGVFWAGIVFVVLPWKLMAGALAGAYFLFSGIFMLNKAVRWPDKWRSCMWYPALAQVFLISLPMLFVRYTHLNVDFSELSIMGLPGPVFHMLSSAVYMTLIASTLVDLARSWRR